MLETMRSLEQQLAMSIWGSRSGVLGEVEASAGGTVTCTTVFGSSSSVRRVGVGRAGG